MNAHEWQRVKSVLDVVLEADPSEWHALVARACNGDTELQRQVERMLAVHERAGTFLESDVAWPPERRADLSGRQIGTYRVESRLGAGGMGEVYRAHDANLDRPVALKILATAVARDPERLRRFRAEARAASSLNHPHILVIHDFGEFEGQPFIVSELVEGETLRQRLRSGPMPVREIITVATQIASALAAAHARGIVHRDIKPENIMVRPDGYAKVLDFGLAKLTAPDLSDGPSLLRTQAGMIMGTPQYMSPEQARGDAIDFRSDQFSLGVVLYELASGRNPFTRDSAIEAAAAVIAEPVEPIVRFCPEIPPPLRWTIERCLAKDRNDRYPSTVELHRDLATVHSRISDIRAQPATLTASNLPVAASPLVGRQGDVDVVQHLLSQPDVRWVTITGPGGVGKTRLALQVAREMFSQFDGAVYLVTLGNIADASLVASTIAETLDVRATARESAMGALKRHVSAIVAPMLLVVDNFEHVTEAAVTIAELLDAAPALKILVSSRSSLHVSAEHEYHLAPLAVNQAVLLFAERAKAVRADFAITPDNAAVIAEICAMLDGLPLAIELAAARIKVLPPAALLSRLQGKRLSLSGGARDLPPRQQALRTTIDWGYELLSPAEQKLFRRLAVFVGGWTIEAAEAVCNAREDLDVDILDGLSSLVDKSLIRSVETGAGDARFTMLETLREYGLERLVEAGEDAITRKAHAAFCLVLAEESGTADAAQQAKWLELCETEHGNLRTALDHLIQARHAEWALRLGGALLPFWQARAHLTEGRDRLTRALAIADKNTWSEPWARAAFALGTLQYSMGDISGTIEVQEEALAIYRPLGDRRGIAVALNGLGVCYHSIHQHDRAERELNEAIGIWRELGHDAAAARTLVNLAAVALDANDVARAIEVYRQVRATCDRIVDRAGAAWAINFEAQAELKRGRADVAEALYADALKRFRALADAWGIGDCLLALGELTDARGEHATASTLLAEARHVFTSAGDIRGTARMLETLARLAAHSRDAIRALKLAGAAAALRQMVSVPLPRNQQDALDRALDQVRRDADQQAVAAAWMEGWALSADEAMQFAFGAQ